MQLLVDMETVISKPAEQQAAYIDHIHGRMRRTMEQRAPGIADAVVHEMTAKPRTFERATGRPDGFVGGVPRTTGLSNYLSLSPPRISQGLYLVGDSAFPGQSTLACAIGGKQVAERVPGRL